MKRALVCGAGGFIGSHMVKRLKDEGYHVIGVDEKPSPDYWDSYADTYYQHNLTDPLWWQCFFNGKEDIDEIYQLAADMGGLGYIATGLNDVEIMTNSVSINVNLVKTLKKLWACKYKIPKVFFSSSSCIYPRANQMDASNIIIHEDSAYPAQCDNNYGWEKLFTERMLIAAREILHIDIRIARLHNTYGPYETYKGNRAKAPASACRKIAELEGRSGNVEVWGTGKQLRTFMYIDDCIEGIRRLMNNELGFGGPVNLGSEEMISAEDLILLVAMIAGKTVKVVSVPGDPDKPMGVPYRTSDNRLLRRYLQWVPSIPLITGMDAMYSWVKERIREDKANAKDHEG